MHAVRGDDKDGASAGYAGVMLHVARLILVYVKLVYFLFIVVFSVFFSARLHVARLLLASSQGCKMMLRPRPGSLSVLSSQHLSLLVTASELSIMYEYIYIYIYVYIYIYTHMCVHIYIYIYIYTYIHIHVSCYLSLSLCIIYIYIYIHIRWLLHASRVRYGSPPSRASRIRPTTLLPPCRPPCRITHQASSCSDTPASVMGIGQ